MCKSYVWIGRCVNPCYFCTMTSNGSLLCCRLYRKASQFTVTTYYSPRSPFYLRRRPRPPGVSKRDVRDPTVRADRNTKYRQKIHAICISGCPTRKFGETLEDWSSRSGAAWLRIREGMGQIQCEIHAVGRHILSTSSRSTVVSCPAADASSTRGACFGRILVRNKFTLLLVLQSRFELTVPSFPYDVLRTSRFASSPAPPLLSSI